MGKEARSRSSGQEKGTRIRLLVVVVIVLGGVAAWVWREPLELAWLRRKPVPEVQRYAQTHPDSLAAQELLARTLLDADRPADAEPVLTPLVERYPERPELRLLLGRALLALGRTRAAYGHLQVAIHDLGAGDAETLYWVGRAEESAGQGDAAFTRFQEALRKDPRHFSTLLHLAQIAAANDRFSEAERYYQQASAADRHSVPALVGVAEMAFHGGRLPEAVEAARRALSLAPQDFGANLWLGRALAATDAEHNGAEAEAAYRRAMEASREKWTPRFYLAQLLREQGRLPAAVVELERNVRENPLHESSFYELSLCERALGHSERAAAAMRRFQRLNRLSLEAAQLEYQLKVRPSDLTLRLKLARLYVWNGRPDLARPQVEQVLRGRPQDPEANSLSREIAAHPEPTL